MMASISDHSLNKLALKLASPVSQSSPVLIHSTPCGVTFVSPVCPCLFCCLQCTCINERQRWRHFTASTPGDVLTLQNVLYKVEAL